MADGYKDNDKEPNQSDCSNIKWVILWSVWSENHLRKSFRSLFDKTEFENKRQNIMKILSM